MAQSVYIIYIDVYIYIYIYTSVELRSNIYIYKWGFWVAILAQGVGWGSIYTVYIMYMRDIY